MVKNHQGNSKLTDEERHKRFVETAKKAGASDNSEDFDKAFNRLNIKKQPPITEYNRTPIS